MSSRREKNNIFNYCIDRDVIRQIKNIRKKEMRK